MGIRSWTFMSSITLMLGSGLSGEQERLWLVQDGRPECVILHGQQDDFAAERLKRWIAEKTQAEVESRPIIRPGEAERGCTILIGGFGSDRVLQNRLSTLGIQADPNTLTDQGYIARTLRHENRTYLVLIGGGRDGAIHAVADLIDRHLNTQAKDVWLAPIHVQEIPRLKYRWLWTWDNRMDWGGPGKPVTIMGGGISHKKPEAYLIDYKRCVDFMADHKFNGLIIWGFLRDHNGGVEAAKELSRYAHRRGVRILPGVGTSGYAGYYYEGKHPFNADTWLKEHPDLRAIEKNGHPHNAPCPSKKANQDWLDRGAEWLFKEFQVGGVNLEMGDFFVCYCDDCKKARSAIASSEPDYYKDMAISHRVTLKTMRRLAPDAWLSYATYTGYSAAMVSSPPKFLSMIPDDSICQWTLTTMARSWPATVRPMARHNIGYLHWCNSSTHTEDDFYLDEIRRICLQSAQAGIEGLNTYGELSDDRPNTEIFYRAWEAFLWNPEMTMEQFVDERLGRLYGGAACARRLRDILPLIKTRRDRSDPNRCAKARDMARSAKSVAEHQGHMRWDRLIAYLDRQEQMAKDAIQQRNSQETLARKGYKVAILSVKASDEDAKKGWAAVKAIDGDIREPEGYWLTRSVNPQQAWIELTLAQPSTINRVVLYHQLNPGHYRSADYTVSVWVANAWKPVVTVKRNKESGWVAHSFDKVTTEKVRLDITRAAHPNRMGIGEIELRLLED